MSTNVLPAMPGLSYPWDKEPTFKTRRQSNVSGKSIRIADWSYPMYTWTLNYSALRQGVLNSGSWTEMSQFEGFFDSLLGGWDSFLYPDSDDNAVVGQACVNTVTGLTTGDGATKNFRLIRAFGGFAMPVLAPNLSVTYTVYLNGVAKVHPTDYAITPWGTSDVAGPGIIEFVAAPGAGVAVTADFQYYFPCAFDDDKLTFRKFMSNIYSLDKVAFSIDQMRRAMKLWLFQFRGARPPDRERARCGRRQAHRLPVARQPPRSIPDGKPRPAPGARHHPQRPRPDRRARAANRQHAGACMKPNSPELLTLLNSRQFFSVDLWTVLPAGGGAALRYCAGDMDVTANGFLYSAGGQVGPYWDRTDNKAKCHWKAGTDVDTLVVDVIPGSALVLGSPFLQVVRAGFFDGAEVMLERALMPTYGDTRRGVLRYFIGRVAEIDAGRSIATFSINSHLELLNLQWPRNVAQPKCMNSLGDASCLATVPTRTFTITGTPTIAQFNATLGASATSGFFDLGKITFTSGVLNGFTATCKSGVITGGTSLVAQTQGFLPSAPSAGDTGTIAYGCNHSLTDANGCAKFSNSAHFRGQPFVPAPAVAV